MTTITSITDAIKALAQSLQLSTIVPAVMWVMVQVRLILPKIWPDFDWSLSNESVLTSAIFASIALSYLLYAFNVPMIRLSEGYIGRRYMNAWEKRKRERFRDLKAMTAPYLPIATKLAACQELDTHFPSDEGYIMPTSLGNTIAAFEHYPFTRYRIDAVALWPRILPVLQDAKYIEVVAQQKALFDFLLNMLYVVLVSGAELVILFAALGQVPHALLVMIVTLMSVWLLYKGACSGATGWGTSVRVAFDLYRGKLWEILRLRPVTKYREEIERWEDVSSFIKEASHDRVFDAFFYELKTDQAAVQSPACKEVKA